MKSKQLRYDRAVTRNLGNAEAAVRRSDINPYRGLDVEGAKRRLGIRKTDDSYDARVSALVSTPK